MRIISATFLRLVTTALAFGFAVTVVAVVGQFFIALADSLGWYKNPNVTVHVVSAFLVAIVTTTWFQCLLAFILGIVTGVRINIFLRQKEFIALEQNSTFINSDIKLRFRGENEIPIEQKSSNIPIWCAVYTPSAKLQRDNNGEVMFFVPTTWFVALVFEKSTKYKEVVATFHSIGKMPVIVSVYQQTQMNIVMQLVGDVAGGELDVFVK